MRTPAATSRRHREWRFGSGHGERQRRRAGAPRHPREEHLATSTDFLDLDEENGRILGGHLIGPDAEEVINLFALAIRQGLTSEDLKSAIFAYPTAASDIGTML